MFAAHFAIDPKRQRIHAKMAAEWIESLDTVCDFRKLAKSGNNALYITHNGEIKRSAQSTLSKSLDFEWVTGSTLFYASHKYTEEGGGSQNTQFGEVKTLLKHFQKSTDKALFLMIVDGTYYTDERMQELKKFERTRSPKSYVMHIEEVPELLDEYTSNTHNTN